MVGQAKNEAVELIFGNLLIGIGGALLGIAYNDVSFIYLVVSAIPIFAAGIILDVRVLRKFSFDLGNVKTSVTNLMNTINRNIADIEKSKNEIDNTRNYLDDTMDRMKIVKAEIEALESDIVLRNTVTNPNLLIRRFESVENFTMFDIDKQPILLVYQKLISENSTDFKSTQDIKLIKLFSLVYNLIWFNNSLLHYKGSKINFHPLINLMNKKNRYYYLCKLKVYEYTAEIDLNLELKIKKLVDMSYNSMIDTQDPSIQIGDPQMVVEEHFVKVTELNEKFKELFTQVNDSLSVKFPNSQCELISNLQYSI